MKRLLLLPFALLLTQCSPDPPNYSAALVRGAAPTVSYPGSSHEIINVSAYDPKERHRSGSSYSEHNVSALKANGARGSLRGLERAVIWTRNVLRLLRQPIGRECLRGFITGFRSIRALRARRINLRAGPSRFRAAVLLVLLPCSCVVTTMVIFRFRRL